MDQSEITRLNLYRDLTNVGDDTNAHLVQHVENGKTYVKKELRNYDRSVFEYIRMRDIAGIPHIVDIIENFGEGRRPDVLIVIEEYIAGSTLREVLDAYGPVKPDIALDYMIQLCEILKPLHDRKRPIVHCRITPENVMITQNGRLYLINFDAAREIDPDSPDPSYKTGTSMKSHSAYIASGQFEYLPVEPQTDILECGSLFREMISGVSPASPTPRVPLLDRPEVEILEPIIQKCTETEPSRRYADAVELLAALEENVPEFRRLIAARTPTSRKKMLLTFLTALLFIAAVVILILFFADNWPPL